MALAEVVVAEATGVGDSCIVAKATHRPRCQRQSGDGYIFPGKDGGGSSVDVTGSSTGSAPRSTGSKPRRAPGGGASPTTPPGHMTDRQIDKLEGRQIIPNTCHTHLNHIFADRSYPPQLSSRLDISRRHAMHTLPGTVAKSRRWRRRPHKRTCTSGRPRSPEHPPNLETVVLFLVKRVKLRVPYARRARPLDNRVLERARCPHRHGPHGSDRQ